LGAVCCAVGECFGFEVEEVFGVVLFVSADLYFWGYPGDSGVGAGEGDSVVDSFEGPDEVYVVVLGG